MSKAPNSLILAGLALAGFFLYKQSKAKAALVGVSARKTADYVTPTDAAGLLARLVVSMTKNLDPGAPVGLASVARPAVPASSSSSLAGWNWLGTDAANSGDVQALADPYASWIAPSVSSISPSTTTRYGASVDAVVAAPIYDLRTDFLNNPNAYAAGP